MSSAKSFSASDLNPSTFSGGKGFALDVVSSHNADLSVGQRSEKRLNRQKDIEEDAERDLAEEGIEKTGIEKTGTEKKTGERTIKDLPEQSLTTDGLTLKKTAEELAIEKSTIEQAIAQLADGDFHSKWDSAKRFSKQFADWGDRVIPHLIDRLQTTTNPEDQWFLVRILGQFDRPEVIEVIAHLLTSTPHDDLQMEATKALTRLGSSAIEVLGAQLAEQPLDAKRILAARALAYIRRSATIVPLLSVAADDNAELRAIALEALGSFHDPRVTPVLLAGLHDRPAISVEAIRALGRRGDLLATTDLIGPLAACLQASEAAVAKESAIALGRLGTDAATTALGSALTQPVVTAAKVAAVRALGWMNTDPAVAYLVRAFDCSVPVVMPSVQQEIARSLGQTQSDELKAKAAEPLIAWLKSTHQLAQKRDRQSLSGLSSARSSAAIDPAANIAADPEAFLLKQTVISTLARLGAVDALDSLVPLLSDRDSRIRMHALSALKRIDPRAAQVKTQAYIEDPHVSPQHRKMAAESLLAW